MTLFIYRKKNICRNGFSLVEVIIVIAIMAILVGVVALAVIPNIKKSHESKDLQTLDNILSAASTAVANAQIDIGDSSVSIVLKCSDDYSCPEDVDTLKGFKKAFNESISGTINLVSDNIAQKDITILLTKGRIETYVEGNIVVPNASSTMVKAEKCEKTMSDSDREKEQLFYVTN